GGRDQIEILDAVGEPARRAGELDVSAGAAEALQPGGERLPDLHRAREQHPRSAMPVGLGLDRVEAREHARLELGAQPPYVTQALGERGLAQSLRRVDAELGLQEPGTPWSEAGEAGDRDQARGKLGAQSLGGGDGARLRQREDLLLER